MKRRDQAIPLFYQHWITIISGKHFGLWTDAANNRSADEDGFQFSRRSPLLEFIGGVDLHYAAIDLAAVSIAFDSDIHQAEALLRRAGNLVRHQDGAGAGAEHRFPPAEFG